MAFMMTTATNARGMITFRNDSFVDHVHAHAHAHVVAGVVLIYTFTVMTMEGVEG